MSTRFCDGGGNSGVTITGTACRCGLVFDDATATIVHPHTAISSHPWYTYTSGGGVPVSSSLTANANWPLYIYYPSSVPAPDAKTFTDMDMSRLAGAYSTIVPKGQKVIICVDMDVTQQQVDHLINALAQTDIDGCVIRGARAGTGYASPVLAFADPVERRLEILARIADCWEQRPDLSLSELLAWMPVTPEKMTDEEFAAATEVYFRKVYGAVHGENT